MVLDIIQEKGQFRLYNIYNQRDQKDKRSPYTIERVLAYSKLNSNSLLAGDLNCHHPWWDPLSQTSPEASKLLEWIESNNLTLFNTPGEGTFFRVGLERETVIDLTLGGREIARRVVDWQVLDDIGSDHRPITFTIIPKNVPEPLVTPSTIGQRYNLSKANFKEFRKAFKENIENEDVLSYISSLEPDLNSNISLEVLKGNLTLIPALDKLGETLTKAISYAADRTIPKLSANARSKPWWNEELKELKEAFKEKALLVRRAPTPSNSKEFLESRNTYFKAIKLAKREHWETFLAKETPENIYKAMAYTKPRSITLIPSIRGKNGVLTESFNDKCKALREGLFPPLPKANNPFSWEGYNPKHTSWDWPELNKEELARACSARIKGKTPGPDNISQDLVIHAYNELPGVFFKVFSTLFRYGYHPACWREATGAVLAKGRPDKAAPKSYRIISLLNCLGKVLERIIAKRLGYLAEKTTLLDPSQIGGRLKKSAVDAALLLTNLVEENKAKELKTSTLFLDIKGAFDHVAQEQLLAIMARIDLPVSLLAWIRSFLNQRRLRLSFNGEIEEFSKVETGIPQGSPVSPILFLIYIRELFPERLKRQITFLSYIDDISLTTSSTSWKTNISILEKGIETLTRLGENSAVEFDLLKTELIHFSKEKKARISSLKLPSGDVIEPKNLVRWLGVFFDPLLTFKEHVSIRVSQARSAFYRLSRLANIERGLSPYAVRQLYLACVNSVLDYACEIYWKNQPAFKRQATLLQNLALRKILGVFKTAPIIPLELEAAIPPPEARFNAKIRNYALRTLKLDKTHPIKATLNRIELGEPYGRASTRLEKLKEFLLSNPLGLDEELDPFYFSPWNQETPYTVRISSKSKEEEAKEHLTLLKNPPQNLITIYSDASSIPNKTGIGVGIVVDKGSLSKEEQTRKVLNLGPNSLVYNGELEGITSALELAVKNRYSSKDIRVYADNQAALYRLKSLSGNPGQACQIRALRAARTLRERDNITTLEWVPGHRNIVGNEEADSLAKYAAKCPPKTKESSLAFYRMLVKQELDKEWLFKAEKLKKLARESSYLKTFSWKIRKKLNLPPTEREIASAFYQLKVGHGYFKSYLYRFSYAETDLCTCGTAKQTPRHLILGCSLYKAPRLKIKERLETLRPSLNSVLNTREGILAMLEYLKETRIATRKWRLNELSEGI